MRLEIITPSSTLFTGDVTLVQLPGIDGLFEILKSHAPLVSALKEGRVKVVDNEDKTQFFDIRGGVVEVSKDKILLLAE
ncbi:MAG: ATP synthase F1 subunit epsilon [Bacteroidales bacterium]|jgi:F-type H+-transporting ATPase subunit epsilon|nr:ATP synthase F1 subunit epsilon [Bacteroidales bacterium]MBQ2514177.1 ATP synthase F1 subunit epsilon [Bacteroidales bacterium]MBR3466742.1 ATP synthase F1 subunit epsilon [Bacteroidales bacterium]MBR4637140.1 ATP synthase F1 subunit epsilon [Bacteroidales bacterium]MBR5920450.1 ATP synthase F1 subunit epsilon [Bacteroidales bacterium]